MAERRVVLQSFHRLNPRTCLSKTKDMYNNDSVVSKKKNSCGSHVDFFFTKLDTQVVLCNLIPYVCNKDKSDFFFLRFPPHCVAFFICRVVLHIHHWQPAARGKIN